MGTVAAEMARGAIVELVLPGFVLRNARQKRSVPSSVITVFVVGRTLVADIVSTLYSQPQDSEMVIGVMVWSVLRGRWARRTHSTRVVRPDPVAQGTISSAACRRLSTW